MSPEDPAIIVALDLAHPEAARELVARLSPTECRLKVGKELFLAGGPGLVSEWVDQGWDVFLDLKFHDIPNTVAAACARACELGVWMVNVHTLGGSAMLQAAREALAGYRVRPWLTGVTILTSHDATTLDEIGLQGPPEAAVIRLASLAHGAALDGVVCSAAEAPMIREHFGDSFRCVTPGIRSPEDAADDQRRVMTPWRALQAGASDLVVGRPITAAADPAQALSRLRESLASGIG